MRVREGRGKDLKHPQGKNLEGFALKHPQGKNLEDFALKHPQEKNLEGFALKHPQGFTPLTLIPTAYSCGWV
ncbi:MAG: hypothetical protein ACK5I7_03845 [Anaerotignum sp.]